MQTEIEQIPHLPRLGVLPVTVSLLEEMFCLPPGYHIASVSYDHWNLILNFVLARGETVPEVDMKSIDDLPRLDLRATAETLPDQPPEYRKITTRVEIR